MLKHFVHLIPYHLIPYWVENFGLFSRGKLSQEFCP